MKPPPQRGRPGRRQHPRWNLVLWYGLPPETGVAELTRLQEMTMPHGLLVSGYYPPQPDRAPNVWGTDEWLLCHAYERRAVSALWAGAAAHRRMRRLWPLWRGGAAPLPPLEHMEVSRQRSEMEPLF